MKCFQSLQDLANTLEAEAAAGTPCPTDWPCRAVDFRILSRIAGGLEHPIDHFDTLLPDSWDAVPDETRTRIPGNPRRNHMRLRAQIVRAIAYHRPELDPWATLAVLAELDCGHHARAENASHAIRRIRSLAAECGLGTPYDITKAWIADQLRDVAEDKETQERWYFARFVDLTTNPLARRLDLLRSDLVMPPTRLQAAAAVEFPDWLEKIAEDEPGYFRSSAELVWRVIIRADLAPRGSIEDILGLLEAGHLLYHTIKPLTSVKQSTWTTYIKRLRTAFLRRVPDPSQYSRRLQHADTDRRKTPAPRTRLSDRNRAQYRLFLDVIAGLDLPEDPDQLLTPKTWPRVAAGMTELGKLRGLSGRSIPAYIDYVNSVLRANATVDVPRRLPRWEAESCTPER